MAATMHLEWTLGDRLAKARRQAKISVEQMALSLGVVPKTINNIERDRTPVKRGTVLAYSMATGIPVDELDPSSVTPDGGGDVPSSSSRCTARSTSPDAATIHALRPSQEELVTLAA